MRHWLAGFESRSGISLDPLALLSSKGAPMMLSKLVRKWLLSPLAKQLQSLESKITMNHAELAQAITAIAAQAEKAKAEIIAQVVTLESAIVAAGSTTPAVDTALAALKATVQGIDDLNADPAAAPAVAA